MPTPKDNSFVWRVGIRFMFETKDPAQNGYPWDRELNEWSS
jgi:hypothetical protein